VHIAAEFKKIFVTVRGCGVPSLVAGGQYVGELGV
jgi:hypothetical protein